jgi:hypothetical protein
MSKSASARLIIPGIPEFDIRGRSITYMILRLVEFWGRHRLTLEPWMNPAVVAALTALADALVEIMTINPPGPD